MTIGIYKLFNVETNNIYIGQSRNIEKRELRHKEGFINNSHHNYAMQSEFNAFTNNYKRLNKDNPFYNYIDFRTFVADNFYTIEIIETFSEYDENKIKEIEDSYILLYRDKNNIHVQFTNKELEQINENRLIKEKIRNEKEKDKRQYINNIELSGDYIKREDEYSLNFTYDNINIKHKNTFDTLNHRHPVAEVLAFIFNDSNRNLTNVTLKYISFYALWKYMNHNTSDIKTALSLLIEYKIITLDKKINKLKATDEFKINVLYENLIDNIVKVLDIFGGEYEINNVN